LQRRDARKKKVAERLSNHGEKKSWVVGSARNGQKKKVWCRTRREKKSFVGGAANDSKKKNFFWDELEGRRLPDRDDDRKKKS